MEHCLFGPSQWCLLLAPGSICHSPPCVLSFPHRHTGTQAHTGSAPSFPPRPRSSCLHHPSTAFACRHCLKMNVGSPLTATQHCVPSPSLCEFLIKGEGFALPLCPQCVTPPSSQLSIFKLRQGGHMHHDFTPAASTLSWLVKRERVYLHVHC